MSFSVSGRVRYSLFDRVRISIGDRSGISMGDRVRVREGFTGDGGEGAAVGDIGEVVGVRGSVVYVDFSPPKNGQKPTRGDLVPVQDDWLELLD